MEGVSSDVAARAIIESCQNQFPTESQEVAEAPAPVVVAASRLVTRNETFYEINSDTPFTGVSLTYYENEQVKNRVTYKDGKLDGLSELYQQNGELSYSVGFDNGDLAGVDRDTLERRYEEYNENGELIYSLGINPWGVDDINWDTILEKRNTLEERGVEDWSELFYEKDSNNPYTGNYFSISENRDNNESEIFLGAIVEGRRPSEAITYTFNIENEWWLERKTIWDGVNIKVSDSYHSNGQLRNRSHYKLNTYESFHEDGTLREKGSYKDGERDGIWENFREDGTTVFRRFKYAGGRLIGLCSRADCSDLN